MLPVVLLDFEVEVVQRIKNPSDLISKLPHSFII